MKKMRKFIAAGIVLSMIVSIFSGCSGNNSSSDTSDSSAAVTTTEDPNKELDTVPDYESMAEIETVDAEYEEGTGSLYESGKTVGKINALCYYDLGTDVNNKAQVEMLATKYGGTIETQMCSSMEYFDMLGKLIASGDSPDIVRYDWQAFPWGTSKNMYTALDDWLDIESPLWSSERDAIEAFTYAGKHYYFPSTISTTATTFSIIYNKLLVDEAGLPDPMDLYFEGNWTWDTFEDMLKGWAEQGEDYKPFTAGSWGAMMFINSTGTKIIDLEGDKIINNMNNSNVQMTMDWLTELKKQGYTGEGYVHPGEAFIDGKLLFLGMGLTWGFESAQESLFKNKIAGEIAAVPIPRCPQADKYYMSGDTIGYLVPAGATNIQGGIDWILCQRIHETDPEIIAQTRAKKMDAGPSYYAKCPDCKYNFVENDCDDLDTCPECGAARKTKFKAVYSEDQMRILDEMKDPEKFTLVYDNVIGFSQDFYDIFTVSEDSVLDGPMFYGASYTQLRETNYPIVEAYLDPYREALAAAAANNS